MDFSKLRTTQQLDVAGKRVLVRTDLNVPLRDGVVTDATRIERVIPGLKDLISRGARVIVLSHLGRPKGERKPEFSLRPVSAKLSELLGQDVTFVDDCVGDAAVQAANDLAPGAVALFENLRYHAGEEANDETFAKSLAQSGDLYVGEAFSAAHRAHASNAGITKFLPSYAGPLMMEEIDALRAALDVPMRPTAAVVGGAKVSTKIPVLENLVQKVDVLIIGGGMANTFLQAQGVDVGKSLSEPEFKETALNIIAKASANNCKIVLPKDAVVARDFKEGAPSETVSVSNVPQDMMILDVGPQSVAILTDVVGTCRTLLWNGPLGAFEIAPFGEGTFALAKAAAQLTASGQLKTIAGGGDTVAALNAAGVTERFSYVSTAGGAFLEWLEGRELPGVNALIECQIAA